MKRCGDKVHIYSIGYGTYEESEYAQLYHEKKFTDAQLEKLVHKAVTKILRNMLKDKPDYIYEDGPSFEGIFHSVCEELEIMGFKKVEFDAKWRCFGWSSLCADNWKGQDDAENIAMRKSIPAKLKSSILKLAKQRKKERDTEKIARL